MARTTTAKAWLTPGIHMAWIGEDIVVLNIHGDGYSCLVGAARHLRQTVDGEIRTSSQTVLKDLEGAGLVTRSKPTHRPEASVAAKRELEPTARPGVVRIMHAAASAARSHTAFQSLSFPKLIASARDFKCGRPPTDALSSPQTLAAVDAFTAALPWLPFEGVCLHRAFLLVRYLARKNIRADWVFGVRTWPFAAHCWVQIGDTIVADRLSRVSGFTPILVV